MQSFIIQKFDLVLIWIFVLAVLGLGLFVLVQLVSFIRNKGIENV